MNLNEMNHRQKQLERLKHESLDQLYARRDLLNIGLSSLREERKQTILEVRNVPAKVLAEFESREVRIQFQIQQVNTALHLVMPPGEQRSVRNPKEDFDAQ